MIPKWFDAVPKIADTSTTHPAPVSLELYQFQHQLCFPSCAICTIASFVFLHYSTHCVLVPLCSLLNFPHFVIDSVLIGLVLIVVTLKPLYYHIESPFHPCWHLIDILNPDTFTEVNTKGSQEFVPDLSEAESLKHFQGWQHTIDHSKGWDKGVDK